MLKSLHFGDIIMLKSQKLQVKLVLKPLDNFNLIVLQVDCVNFLENFNILDCTDIQMS